MTGVQTCALPICEQFDTLSDFLSFGIAPGILIYRSAQGTFGNGVWIAAFVYLFAVAVRLARFGVKSRPARKGFFEGLSSPPSASTLAAFVLFMSNFEWSEGQRASSLMGLGLFLAVLMVSYLPFPTFKQTDWKSPDGRAALVCGVIGVAASIYRPSVFLFVWGFSFIVGVLIWNLALRLRFARIA